MGLDVGVPSSDAGGLVAHHVLARAGAQDMLKISQREVGEISQMAEYFAIALSTQPGTDTGDDEGTAAYMMLRSIGDLP